MSILLAAMYPETYRHDSTAKPRQVALETTEQRGKRRTVRPANEARPEIIALLQAGVLTLSELMARTGIPKATVFRTLKTLAQDGLIDVVTDDSGIPARHYWRG